MSMALACLLASAAAGAVAGEQYVDALSFAVSGYDMVAYSGQEQSPTGHAQPPAIPGERSITAEYNGATFAFASEENRRRFTAGPGKYAPAFDGHCAYGMAKGGKVPVNPHLWRVA